MLAPAIKAGYVFCRNYVDGCAGWTFGPWSMKFRIGTAPAARRPP